MFVMKMFIVFFLILNTMCATANFFLGNEVIAWFNVAGTIALAFVLCSDN